MVFILQFCGFLFGACFGTILWRDAAETDLLQKFEAIVCMIQALFDICQCIAICASKRHYRLVTVVAYIVEGLIWEAVVGYIILSQVNSMDGAGCDPIPSTAFFDGEEFWKQIVTTATAEDGYTCAQHQDYVADDADPSSDGYKVQTHIVYMQLILAFIVLIGLDKALDSFYVLFFEPKSLVEPYVLPPDFARMDSNKQGTYSVAINDDFEKGDSQSLFSRQLKEADAFNQRMQTEKSPAARESYFKKKVIFKFVYFLLQMIIIVASYKKGTQAMDAKLDSSAATGLIFIGTASIFDLCFALNREL